MSPNIDYLGNDWQNFRRWLAEEQLDTYKRLTNINSTEQETQQLRGRALFIELLLDLHNTAA